MIIKLAGGKRDKKAKKLVGGKKDKKTSGR